MSLEREKRRQRRQTRLDLVWVVAVSCFCLVALRIWPSSVAGRRLRSSRQEASVDDNSLQLQYLSNVFPSLQDTLEMARLSGLVYEFLGHDACNATNAQGEPLLPSDLRCHMYNHSHAHGTQVMILSSTSQQYIAVVYAGTDDLRTTLTDGDILMKPFGTLDGNGDSILIPGPARVHAGFDNAVFMSGLFDPLLDSLKTLLHHNPHYRLFTTGHSLGAADSILTAVALTKYLIVNVTSISFGCPNTGNWHWHDAVHELSPRLAIWRFVHGWDVVPRLPQYPFEHVGHTVQMNTDSMKAYYLHYGNQTLGYEGVPLGWSGTFQTRELS
jgi:Lipase (class 3)